MPKISVLVATKNSSGLIRGCLDSLLKQTIIKNAEIIIIDGNPGGKDQLITSKYQKIYPNIEYIPQNKSGLYNAWNIEIAASKSKYLTNLNTDDRLSQNALEMMAETLDKNPGVAVVYGDSYVTKKANETFKKNSSQGKRLHNPAYSHKKLLISCILGPHPMWRRELHNTLGYFDESYKLIGDYEFWLRVAEKYKMLRTPKIIGLYYCNPNGLTNTNPDILKKEKLKLKRKYLTG